MSYSTVVVGSDGSPSSVTAVSRAAELAASDDALLVVVCAYSAVTPRERATANAMIGDTRFYEVRGTAAAEEALTEATRHAQDAGASGVQGRLVENDAAEALLSVAADCKADLIVVGNRGINTLSGRLLGSVPSDVSQRSACDVLIVHSTEGGHS